MPCRPPAWGQAYRVHCRRSATSLFRMVAPISGWNPYHANQEAITDVSSPCSVRCRRSLMFGVEANLELFAQQSIVHFPSGLRQLGEGLGLLPAVGLHPAQAPGVVRKPIPVCGHRAPAVRQAEVRIHLFPSHGSDPVDDTHEVGKVPTSLLHLIAPRPVKNPPDDSVGPADHSICGTSH